jgi:hypothetical protein
MTWFALRALAAAAAAAFLALSAFPTRSAIPAHMQRSAVVAAPDFLSAAQVDDLWRFTRETLGTINSTILDDFKPHDSIGEDAPYDAALRPSGCPSLMIPDRSKTTCRFAGRMDVGQHFFKYGGATGVKESYATLTARLSTFSAFMFDWRKHEVPTKFLTKDEKFVAMAQAVCPEGKPLLEPFQFNIIVNLPGQSILTHIAAPYFQRAGRFDTPQWLLAVMMFSGLWQEDFIDQVQMVAYFHRWADPEGKRAGKFFLWNDNGAPQVMDPVSGSANSVDGSKLIHSAEIYMPEVVPYAFDPTKKNQITYVAANESWNVVADGAVVDSVPESLMRFSAVYRGRCFKDEAAQRQYHADQARPWTQREVLAKLEADLERRGLWSPADKMSPYDFGLLLMDTYIRYPLPLTAWVPLNYCMLGHVWPALQPLLKLLCD